MSDLIPRSVMDLIPQNIQDAISRIPEDLLNEHEHELRKRLKPDLTLDRIRIAFWLEYDEAQTNGRMMQMQKVYRGACHHSYFSHTILKKPEMLAWMMCPPTDYILSMRALLNRGIRQLEAIVDSDIHDEDGKLIPSAANTVLKVLQMMDVKVHGSIVQRVETKTLNVNANVKDVPSSLEDVEKRLLELQKEKKQLESSKVIDVGRSEED